MKSSVNTVGRRSEKGSRSLKKAPRSVSKLKADLDRIFSLFIRAKYLKSCYTCGYVGKLQNGHFVSRAYLPTRWNESNCRPQCAMCNIWGRGKLLDFEENLIKELGLPVVQHLKEIRKEIWKLDREWYLEQIRIYTQKLSEVARGQP